MERSIIPEDGKQEKDAYTKWSDSLKSSAIDTINLTKKFFTKSDEKTEENTEEYEIKEYKIEKPTENEEETEELEKETEEESTDEESNEETDEESSKKPLPIGTIVKILNYRAEREGDYRYNFTDRMMKIYGGKCLKISYSCKSPGQARIPDDGYEYHLHDIYGRPTRFVWASSMFQVVDPIYAQNEILYGLSKGLRALRELMECYLLCPSKVGTQSSPYYVLSPDQEEGFVIRTSENRGLFSFSTENDAREFAIDHMYELRAVAELF